MSASDDGTRLYVTHYASSSVARIDLTTMLLNTVFLLNYPGQGPGYALAAEPRPGDASTFAYIEHYPAVSTVFTRMISNLTLRPLSFDEPISTMAFVNADTLFGNNTGAARSTSMRSVSYPRDCSWCAATRIFSTVSRA